MGFENVRDHKKPQNASKCSQSSEMVSLEVWSVGFGRRYLRSQNNNLGYQKIKKLSWKNTWRKKPSHRPIMEKIIQWSSEYSFWKKINSFNGRLWTHMESLIRKIRKSSERSFESHFRTQCEWEAKWDMDNWSWWDFENVE